MNQNFTEIETITDHVRERYAAAAQRVRSGVSCCGSSCCAPEGFDQVVTKGLYDQSQTSDLPDAAVAASLGCGNPTALIDLMEGDVVLDLGSGGGIDVLLSAKRVGPAGFVYGLDMTDEMLALALENKARAGVTNVAFLKGRIEEVPLPANSVDVIVSNCVINLAADKSAVLREAYRVLRPGGRFAVADVVADGPVPESLRGDMEAWVGCVAGALDVDVYSELLAAAGFTDIDLEITRRYALADAGLDCPTLSPEDRAADGKIASAFIRARKPLSTVIEPASMAGVEAPEAATAACCGSGVTE